MKYNYVRRGIGVLICGSPIWLAVVSGVMSFYHSRPIAGGWNYFFILAGLIAPFNLYLSFIRPWLYRWKHQSMEGYRFISGIPGIGTILVILGLLACFQDLPSAIIGVVITIFDCGGLPWFLVFTWRQKDMWDDKDMKVF
jgi:hypothetical protein